MKVVDAKAFLEALSGYHPDREGWGIVRSLKATPVEVIALAERDQENRRRFLHPA